MKLQRFKIFLHEISKGGLETTTQASQMIWSFRHSCRFYLSLFRISCKMFLHSLKHPCSPCESHLWRLWNFCLIPTQPSWEERLEWLSWSVYFHENAAFLLRTQSKLKRIPLLWKKLYFCCCESMKNFNCSDYEGGKVLTFKLWSRKSLNFI